MKKIITALLALSFLLSLIACTQPGSLQQSSPVPTALSPTLSPMPLPPDSPGSGVFVEVKRSIIEDLDRVTRGMSHIFIGTYVRTEQVEGVESLVQDIYSIDDMLKAPVPWPKTEIPVMYGRFRDLDVIPQVGKPYLVFLIEADLSVYPVPLMSVGTVVPLTAKRSIDVRQTAELMRYFPCFNTPAVIADPVAAIRATPGFAKVPDSYVGPMPERYADMPSLVSGSDLVMQTRLSILSPAGGGTAYGCLLADDARVMKNDTSAQPPNNVVVTLRPEPEEEYLVFFRWKSRDGNNWDLAARQGAVIAKSDAAAWDEAMALLKK